MRARDVDELWYLVADSLNFHDSLGDEAGYAIESNVRLLASRLGKSGKNATRDAFVDALVAGAKLPQPVESLTAFLRVAAKTG